MTYTYQDDFIDSFRDQGRVEGEARMLLRMLIARGFAVPEDLRDRVLSRADTTQLETWGDRAATADSLDVVFGD